MFDPAKRRGARAILPAVVWLLPMLAVPHAPAEDVALFARDRHVLLVISAARRLDSAKLKRALGVKKTRFATADELHDLTGLVPGAVPPFGEPVLPLPLYVDASVLANQRIAFNAGSLTDSIIMSVDDYRRVASIEEVIDVARDD